jgi:hypothetical protein
VIESRVEALVAASTSRPALTTGSAATFAAEAGRASRLATQAAAISAAADRNRPALIGSMGWPPNGLKIAGKVTSKITTSASATDRTRPAARIALL